MNCSSCGKPYHANQKFCRHCGAAVAQIKKKKGKLVFLFSMFLIIAAAVGAVYYFHHNDIGGIVGEAIPTVTPAPTLTEVPYITEKPIISDKPVETEKPVISNKPVETEAPHVLVTKIPAEKSSPLTDFEYAVYDNYAAILKYTGSDTEVAIPLSIDDKPVTNIGDYAFYGCNVNSVKIPETVDYIGEAAFLDTQWYNDPANYKNGFLIINDILVRYNGASTNVKIPDGIASICAGAFLECTQITEVTIPESVWYIGGAAFYGCTGLKSVELPDSVSYIGDVAFLSTPWLEETAASKGGMYIYKDVLLRYNAQNASAVIPDGVAAICGGAFFECVNLKSVTLPDSVTHIGRVAFHGCSALESITIPNGVTYISDYTFTLCSSLIRVTIPDNVTHIGENAFYGCVSLTSVVIPKNVAYIGANAFGLCFFLQSVYFEGDAPVYNGARFGDSPNMNIYYRDKASGWTNLWYERPATQAAW